jgi:PIN domain nuclease of toxin-antitoxin system
MEHLGYRALGNAKLAQLGRIELDIDSRDFARFLVPVLIWPLTLDVCAAIMDLDFKRDPAVDIISATSLGHEVPLVTRDAKLRRSSIVPLA